MRTTEAITVNGSRRAEILNYASRLLSESDRQDAEAVTAMAAPLLEWVAQAPDADDQTARMNALRRQSSNTPERIVRVPGGSMLVPSVTPENLLAGAKTLHGFIAGR